MDVIPRFAWLSRRRTTVSGTPSRAGVPGPSAPNSQRCSPGGSSHIPSSSAVTSTACDPVPHHDLWTRADARADQAPSLQQAYGSTALRSPSVQVLPATHTDHDVL